MKKAKLFLLGCMSIFVFSCSTDKDVQLSQQEETISADEIDRVLDTDSYTSSVDMVIADLVKNRSAKTSRLNCFETSYSETGYVVNFNDCSIEGSERISGTLSVTYMVGNEERAYTATYTDLTVGDVIINGTRAFDLSGSEGSNITFAIESNMTITLDDGSIVEERGAKNISFDFDEDSYQNSLLTLSGNWTLKVDDNNYVVNITSPLETKFLNCRYIGKGIMNFNKNGLSVTVDFGDGTCDDVAAVTFPDGTVSEIRIKGN